MITKGTSSIKGQASTKLYDDKRIFNKTQYPPKGSLVMLIPNTPYFKEWMDFNLAIGKVSPPYYMDGQLLDGCALYPINPEVKKQMLITDVIDDKGNFAFPNQLKPGEYLVFVGYVATKYSHTTKTPTGDYSITEDAYGNLGLKQIHSVKKWFEPTNVMNLKYIKISKDGEIVNVKLKD